MGDPGGNRGHSTAKGCLANQPALKPWIGGRGTRLRRACHRSCSTGRSLGSIPGRTGFCSPLFSSFNSFINHLSQEAVSDMKDRVSDASKQRALRVRQRPQQPDKASRHEGAKERPQNEAPKPASGGADADTLPFPRVPSLPTAENEGMQAEENAEVAKARITQAERGKSVENGFGWPMAAEEFRTILVHLLHYTPFR